MSAHRQLVHWSIRAYRWLARFGGSRVEYVGLPAVPLGSDANREAYYLHVDRQLVQVVINQPQAASRPQLELLLLPPAASWATPTSEAWPRLSCSQGELRRRK